MTDTPGQEPGLGQTVHALAKPMTRMTAWTLTVVAAVALAAAAVRTVRES